jgi:hypothetical protein
MIDHDLGRKAKPDEEFDGKLDLGRDFSPKFRIRWSGTGNIVPTAASHLLCNERN